MSLEPSYDLAIIGSGSAAFAAAIAATEAGASTVLIERDLIGGTCVNIGCVPSKALIAGATGYYKSFNQKISGISGDKPRLSMKDLVNYKTQLVGKLRQDKYIDLAKLYDFPIVVGSATFNESGNLEVDGKTIVAKNYLIATGASPYIPSFEGLDNVEYLTSTTALELTTVPKTLTVIGANAVGLELAQIFLMLGAKVTLIEAKDRIAPFEEPEISATLNNILVKEGMGIVTEAKITKLSKSGSKNVVEYEFKGRNYSVAGEKLLIATGRRANTHDLNLENVGVKVDPIGNIVVNDELQTDNPQVFAAGDVTGHPQFVYVAGHHGKMVVDNAIYKLHRKVDYKSLPKVTFTVPNIASVGMTAQQAETAGIEYRYKVLDLSQVPRALVENSIEGLVKLVIETRSQKILGIHMLADNASEAILAGVYAIDSGYTVEKLANSWTPYLTMAESIKLVAQSFNKDVATLSCCAS